MVDLAGALAARARTAAELALEPFRRGHRTVHLASPMGIGFGNYLYLMFDAYRQQRSGIDYVVLRHPPMSQWLKLIPEAAAIFCIPPEVVKFTDRRERWTFRLGARYGTDFTREELHAFIRQHLLLLTGGPSSRRDEVTVNVRRGDYYSNHYVRGTHGRDLAAYLPKYCA